MHPPTAVLSTQLPQAGAAGQRVDSRHARAAVDRFVLNNDSENDREVLRIVLREHMREALDGPSLERRLGLERTPNGRDFVGRELALREAVRQYMVDEELGQPVARHGGPLYLGLSGPQLDSFCRDWGKFVQRGRWQAWRGLAAPPERSEPIDVAFFHLTVANGRRALTARQLRNLLAEETGPEVSDVAA